MPVEQATPLETWGALVEDSHAMLVDVRTPAEWAEVGIPDLSGLGRQVLLLPWQVMPGAPPDPAFAEKLSDFGIAPHHPVFFLCRIGRRSMAAAQTAAAAGFAHCVNVTAGFEGMPDAQGRTGLVNGWVADGLPWQRPDPDLLPQSA